MGGTGYDKALGISAINGNVYVTGYFGDTSFNLYDASGVDTRKITLKSEGGLDGFIAQYDSSGRIQWAAKMGGTYGDEGLGISADTLGNVYVTGKFSSEVFNLYDANGLGLKTLTNPSTSDREFIYDAFIAQYDSSGYVKWAAQMGGSSYDQGLGISTDQAGNVYVTGIFLGTEFKLYDENGVDYKTVTSEGGGYAFIAQYDSSGHINWAAKMGGTSNNKGLGISADTSGNVYVTGYFSSGVLKLYDENGVDYKTLTSEGILLDAFIAQYDSSGRIQWAAQMGGTGFNDQGLGISAINGNVYVTGTFQDQSFNLYDASGVGNNSITLKSEGNNDGFIAQYDSSGHINWAAKMGGTLGDQALGISTDQAGNVYVTGLFNNTSFNLYDASGGGFKTLTNTNTNKSIDAFIAQYDSSGRIQWAANMGGTLSDEGSGISADNSGNVYVTGYFQSPSFKLYSSIISTQETTQPSTSTTTQETTQQETTQQETTQPSTSTTTQETTQPSTSTTTTTTTTTKPITLTNSDTIGTRGTKGEAIGTLVYTSDAFIAQYDSFGHVQWAAKMGGLIGDEGLGISAINGNVYVTGSFQDQSFNLYDASGGGYKTLTSEGNDDAFIAQYDSSGHVQWAAQIGGTLSDKGLGISAINGNVYVTGSFRSDTSFNLYDASGVGNNSKTLTSEGDFDGFIAQYDSSGRIQWAAKMGGTGFDQALGISTDQAGNVYVTGFFQDQSFNLYDASGGGTNSINLTSEGNYDGFIAQYDSSGYVKWAAQMGGSSYDQGLGISTDQAGNVYVTGSFVSDSFNLYDASGVGSNSITLTSKGNSDGFIAQYDSSGRIQWAANMGGTGFDQGIGISAINGNVYVTGNFRDGSFNLYDASGVGSNFKTLTSEGDTDAFIAQYDSSGRIQWAAKMGGTFDDIGYGISADQSGNVYVTGYFQDPSFNLYDASGGGYKTLTSEGGFDGFIAQYDSSGHINWAANMGGGLDDGGSGISAINGNVYVTGSFQSPSFKLYSSIISTQETTQPSTSTTTQPSTSTTTQETTQPSTSTTTTTTTKQIIEPLTLTNTNNDGSSDAFIVQYNSTGDVQWAAQMGGILGDQGSGISAINGNVYVTGNFRDTSFNLYDASGVGSNSITLTSEGNLDAFLAQYDSSGRIQWAAKMGGTYGDEGLGISADTLGNVYVTGKFSSEVFNLYDANGLGLKTLTNPSTSDREFIYDAFIAQYDSSGYVKWAAQMGGSSYDQGLGISTDQAGNVYVTGIFLGTEFKLYDENGVDYKTVTSEGGGYAFIAQYDSSGHINWAAKMGGTSNNKGLGISADTSGNVYVTGYFSSGVLKLYDENGVDYKTLTSEGILLDAFIAQYDSSGRIQWAAQMGGTGFNDQGLGISAINGNVYVTGSFQGAEFKLYDASGGGFKPLTSEGDTDGFIAQYDSSGRIQWAANMGGSSYDQGLGISTDQAGNVYVTGRFDSRSFNLYDASGGGFKTLTNEGSLDGFIAQYDSSGKVQWAANMGGTLVDQGSGISTDNSGNVYVTGFFQSPSFKLYSSIIS